MDIITFQSKRFGRVSVCSGKTPYKRLVVLLHGKAFFVRDPEAISFLNDQGKYGHKMGERQNNVNPDVFSDQPESVREYWSSKTPSVCSLELSFEEVFYLYFKKNWIVVYEQSNALTAEDLWNVFTRENRSKLVEKLVVYSQLRDFGWCVRSGLTYGCQYLVYKECPSNYHASAGVFIKNATEPNHLVSLTRALTNVKKALIIATITFPTGFNLLTIDDLKNINVEFLTANTFFPERLENRETL